MTRTRFLKISALIVVMLLAVGGIALIGLPALIGALATLFAATLGLLSRKRPNVAAAVWLLVLVLVPPWISVSISGYRIAPAVILSAVVIAGRLGLPWPKLNKFDWVVFLLAASLILAVVFGSPAYLAVQGIGEWVLCYIAARLLFSELSTGYVLPLVTVGVILAALSVVQSLTLLDASAIFPSSFGSTAGSEWRALQYRGGTLRSEVTLGHSIALAGVLTLCLPFVFRLKSILLRTTFVVLIVGGVFATQSRAGLVAIALVFTLLLVTTRRLHLTSKLLLLLGPAAILIVSLPGLVSGFVFGGGDSSSEITQGTDYRVSLLEAFTQINLLGLGRNASLASDGVTYVWGAFQSIDNGFLYLGLYLGAASALLFVIPTVFVVVDGFKLGWSIEQIAILSQIPLFLTVAPITQYQSVYWFVIGLAASLFEVRRLQSSPLANRKSSLIDDRYIATK